MSYRLAGKLEEATDLLNAMVERMLLNRQQAMAEGGDTTNGQKAMLARAYAVLALCTTHENTRAAAKVCGWGAYCCDFLLLPIAPSVSCSCVDALNTPSSKLQLSPTVSRFLQPF